MHFDATGFVMKTFFKSPRPRKFFDGVWVLVFLVIVVVVGAVVADRAIHQGKNVSLTVASFFTLTATAPTSAGIDAQPASAFPESK
jgi:hypothetical protein